MLAVAGVHSFYACACAYVYTHVYTHVCTHVGTHVCRGAYKRADTCAYTQERKREFTIVIRTFGTDADDVCAALNVRQSMRTYACVRVRAHACARACVRA